MNAKLPLPAHLPDNWDALPISPVKELPAIVQELDDDFFEHFQAPARPGRKPRTTPFSAGLESISFRHEQIANWMILNPHASLAECAAHFQYSRAYISRIIHSDAFRGLLEQKNKEVFAAICGTIPQKLASLADLAIEKVTEHLEDSDNPDFALDVFDKTLNRLGYGPSKGQVAAPVVQTNLFVSASDLAAARGVIVDSSAGAPVGRPVESAQLCLEASAVPGPETERD